MSQWISVKYKRPAIGEVCLLYQTYPAATMFNCRADPLVGICFMRIGGLIYDGRFVSYENQYIDEELKHVSHWMSLPDPPAIFVDKEEV